jgi:hypothetical protein
MRTALLLCSVCAALGAAPAKDPYPVSVPAVAVPHPPADAPGFTPLFNGKDLAGWQTKGNWVYEPDGSVTLKPRAGETGWKRFDAYLFTAKKYRDFVLDLEFKIEPTGNSGVFFCVADPLNPVDKGIELQVLDTYGLATPGNHDWNRYTLTLKDRLLQVDFNGERIIVLKLDDSPMKDRPAEGHVGFQDEAKRVWYRGVRIRELK